MANRKWTDELPCDVYRRLCACKTIKEDLATLVSVKWAAMVEAGKADQGFTKEDALVQILELLDCNGQWQLADLTRAEYDELKA